MRVTIIVPPFTPQPDLPTMVSSRKLNAIDRLAQALGTALGIDVPIVEGDLAGAPPSGFLVVPGVPRDLEPELGPRIVAFDEGRSSIMNTVERV
jgi:hypothetical protein